MRKPKREYRNRRVYFQQFAPNPMAHWQTDDYKSPDIKWLTVDKYLKCVTLDYPYPDDGNGNAVAEYIKENIPGARLVYDMLLMLYGIEFESDDTMIWFMLKYA